MTELMKRYEAETGEKAVDEYTEYVNDGYVRWLENQLTWRPVSEGLPKRGQRVLYLGNDIDIGEYNGYGEWIDTDGGVLLIQRTTHWLPIPPAPKGE